MKVKEKESYDREDPERLWPSWMTVEPREGVCRAMLRREEALSAPFW